jgi:hypothetical protein
MKKLEIDFEAIKNLPAKELEELIDLLSQYHDEAYNQFILRLRDDKK